MPGPARSGRHQRTARVSSPSVWYPAGLAPGCGDDWLGQLLLSVWGTGRKTPMGHSHGGCASSPHHSSLLQGPPGWGGYRDHHRLPTMIGNGWEFPWLQKIFHIHPEWSAVGHHQGRCPADHSSETLPKSCCGSNLTSCRGHQDVAGAWVHVCWGYTEG